MIGLARQNDSILGAFSGEHGGHYPNGVPAHPSGTITGSVSRNCSTKLFINQIPIAIKGSITSEHDVCTDGEGVVSGGSDKLFVKGVAIARLNDPITPHTTGYANISSASDKVLEG